MISYLQTTPPFVLLAISSLMNAAADSAKGPLSMPGLLIAAGTGVASVLASLLNTQASRKFQKTVEKSDALNNALRNEHLAHAAAHAVKITLLKQRHGGDNRDLEQLADAAEEHWLKLQSRQEPSVALFSEPELEKRLIEYLGQGTSTTNLDAKTWQALLEEAKAFSEQEINLDSGQLGRLAEVLAREYPAELYAAFKSDLASGGAAFGGMVLRLLCRIAVQGQTPLPGEKPSAKPTRTRAARAQLLTQAIQRDAEPIIDRLDQRTRDVLESIGSLRRELVRRARLSVALGAAATVLIVSLLAWIIYRVTPANQPRVSAGFYFMPVGSSQSFAAAPVEPLFTDDQVSIDIQPQGEAFLYAFWLNQNGKIIPLFPAGHGPLSSGSNPVHPRTRITIPAERPLKMTDPPNETYKIYVLSSPSPLTEIDQAFKTPEIPFDQALCQSLDAAAGRSTGEGRKGEPRSGDASAARPTPLQRDLQQGVVQVHRFEIQHLGGKRIDHKPQSP